MSNHGHLLFVILISTHLYTTYRNVLLTLPPMKGRG